MEKLKTGLFVGLRRSQFWTVGPFESITRVGKAVGLDGGRRKSVAPVCPPKISGDHIRGKSQRHNPVESSVREVSGGSWQSLGVGKFESE